MEISLARDWVIVIVGIIEIILLIGLIIGLVIVYNKINKLIKKGQETVQKVERTVSSPYYKIGAWLFRAIAAALGSRKRKAKEERANGRK